MMLWYLTLGRLKKKKSSSAESLLVIFETGFLLHFFLFKWFALLISARRFQDYAKDENKTSISRIRISEMHSLLHFVVLSRSLLWAWFCSYFQFCLILSHNFYIITHWWFFFHFSNHYLNHKKKLHDCIHNVPLMWQFFNFNILFCNVPA